MMSQESAWLNGRELLISEIEIRVEAMRSEAKTRGFRAGCSCFSSGGSHGPRAR